MLFFTSFGYGFINVEPPVIGEKEGIDEEVSLSVDYRSGNSDKSAIGTSGKGAIQQPRMAPLFYLRVQLRGIKRPKRYQ